MTSAPRELLVVADASPLILLQRSADCRCYAGRALLTGDHGPLFTPSYYTLSARLQVADGRDLARGNYALYPEEFSQGGAA